MSIIFALIIFSALVLFHELGHFLLAKRGGIAVTEFSLGMDQDCGAMSGVEPGIL